MAKSKPKYKRIAQLKTQVDFKNHIESLGIEIPLKSEQSSVEKSPLAAPLTLSTGREIGNRFCILPMEGWDGTIDGLPTEDTKRRWHNFAISGAKLLWGCEAVAVNAEGRANPNQLWLNEENLPAFKELFNGIVHDHTTAFSTANDLCVGLQLTHSGRFASPNQNEGKKPKILYNHSILNRKFNIPSDYTILSDSEIEQIIKDFIKAADLAARAGFHFVDVKHCHGYLGHEFLSNRNKSSRFGGSLSHRMEFLKQVVAGIKSSSNIPVGVRLSAFDFIPFKKDNNGTGIPEYSDAPYHEGFGCDPSGTGIDLTETFMFLEELQSIGIELICITAGSPYYIPHIQRPALFPPSDGYLPPEDPLVGVARLIDVTAEIKSRFPNLVIVGSGYSYLQEWIPQVAEAVIDEKKADFIGLGRLVLSYPEFPKDVLNGNQIEKRKLCRTFSDCTTAPRHGMISGCYPLDPYYKRKPEATDLKSIKQKLDSMS